MIKVTRPAKTSDSGGGQKSVQFLSPRHVDAKGTVMSITKVTTDKPDNFGNPYVVFFKAGNGEKYSKGFKDTSSHLADIVDILGDDEKKWIGKSLLVSAVVDDDDMARLHFAKAK